MSITSTRVFAALRDFLGTYFQPVLPAARLRSDCRSINAGVSSSSDKEGSCLCSWYIDTVSSKKVSTLLAAIVAAFFLRSRRIILRSWRLEKNAASWNEVGTSSSLDEEYSSGAVFVLLPLIRVSDLLLNFHAASPLSCWLPVSPASKMSFDSSACESLCPGGFCQPSS